MFSNRRQSRKNAGPFSKLIVALFLLGMGSVIVFFSWKWRGALWDVNHWTPVPCKVTRFEVDALPAEGRVFASTLQLTFEYEAGGAARQSNIYDASGGSLPTLNELEELGARARAGGIICYFNPADPDSASLTRPSLLGPGIILTVGLLLALGGAFLLLSAAWGLLKLLLPGLRGAIPPVVPAGSDSRKRSGCLGSLLIFATFTLAGTAVWKFAIHDSPDWKGIAPTMQPVKARVLASGVEAITGSGKNRKTSYKPKVAFSYEYGGRTWRSGWLDFDRGTVSDSDRGDATESAARHPAGQETTCWVDPAAPWQAVLEKEGGRRVWLWLFVILFVGVGILVPLATLRRRLFGGR